MSIQLVDRRTVLAVLSAFLLPAAVGADEKKREQSTKIRVTVIAILASDQHKNIDKEISEIAAEVRKKEPGLTGFKIERTSSKSLRIGQREGFALVEDAEVSVLLKEEENHRVSITIKPPTVGDISYSCCCGKYLPVVTRYVTKDNCRLIIAVMVKPCTTQ